MDKEAIFKALDGFETYETGGVDAGIHDPAFRMRVFAELNGMSKAERDALLIEWTQVFEDEDDLQENLRWLKDNGILPDALRAALE